MNVISCAISPSFSLLPNNYGEENVFKGYRTGAVDYIYKPVNPALPGPKRVCSSIYIARTTNCWRRNKSSKPSTAAWSWRSTSAGLQKKW